MPKIKISKTVSKRVELTGSGKVRARKMSVAHRARFKSRRALNQSDDKQTLSAGFSKKVKRILGVKN